MGLIKNRGYRIFNGCLLAAAFVLTCACIITGSYVQDKENIQVGQVSPKRYVAQREVEDVAATERLREEARESVGPLYKHDTQVQEATIEKIQDFFTDIDNALASGTEEEDGASYNRDAVLKIPVALTDKQYRTYNMLTTESRAQFQQDVLDVTNFVFEQGITEETLDKALVLVSDGLEETIWNDDLKDMGYLIVAASLEPNLVLDEEAMQAAMETKAAEVEPVMIYKNQKIVDEGEIITQSIYDKLVLLNLVNQDYSDNILPIIGSLGVVALLFIAAGLYFAKNNNRILKVRNEILTLFFAYVLTIVILRVTANMTNFYVIPITIFAMLVSILISTRLAVVLNLFVCIVGTFIFNGNMEFLLYFLITGTFSALLTQYTEKRNRIFWVAVAIGAVHFLSYITVGMFFENGYSSNLFNGGVIAAITGLLTVIVAVGSLPFWEAVFQVNTPIKLLELTNPNNELMRRLMLEAPGTYHHSLIVANLAETAAYDLNANTTLARVGAYYHDIGKLKYPLYFAENQAGENPHDNLEPLSSARMIIDHVKYGKELAEENKLPKAVKDILVEHHGTTLVKYFYFKATKLYGAENVNEKDFRYDGPIPQTKESAIVMLADTIEAAIRSSISNGKTFSEIDGIMQGLIKDKLDDGQLNDCNLTLRDLKQIRQSFMTVFNGLYHERVSYPKEEELKEALEKSHMSQEKAEEKAEEAPELEQKEVLEEQKEAPQTDISAQETQKTDGAGDEDNRQQDGSSTDKEGEESDKG